MTNHNLLLPAILLPLCTGLYSFSFTDEVSATGGVVIALENTGPSALTEIVLGFDVPPISPNQTLDFRIGDAGSPTNVGEFRVGGIPVSRDNPLPPRAIACTEPLSQIVPGTYIDFEQVQSFGNGSSTSPSIDIITDVTTLTFDFPHSGVTGGRLAGMFKFLSTSPCIAQVSVNSESSITLSTTSGPTGTSVTVTGKGFSANSPITIKFGSVTLTTAPSSVTTSSSGTFSATISIPTGVAIGSYTISAADVSGRTSSAVFTIIQVNAEPKITISPASGPPGSTVTIAGSGLSDDTSMAVLFDHALLRETRTDASGTFIVTVMIPITIASGSHSITLSDIPESLYATFTVTPPALLVSPNAGVPGASVALSGSNFGASKGITIKFDDTSISSITANLLSSSLGTFSTAVNIPITASAGGHTISATDGRLTASGVFNIAQASITLSSTSSGPSAAITVTGTGFSANSPITVKFDSTRLASTPTSIITSPFGTFSSIITIPAVLASGVDIVSATDASGRTGSAVINIIVPAAITLSKTGGVQGSTVNVSGSNFSPNSEITIKFDSTVLTPTAKVTANILGSFDATINIPSDVSIGSHTISVIDTSGKTTPSLFLVTPHAIIAISPQTGPPGTEVIINGWNFVNDTKISINFNSNYVGTYPHEIFGSKLGKFIGKFRVPANTTEGTYTITAEDFTGRLGTATFTVAKDGLSLSLSSGNGKGGTVSVAGWGFAPGNLVTISFDEEMVPTTPLKIFASRTGTFAASFNVPGNAPNGNHIISAISNEKVANATLTLKRNYIDDRYGILIDAFPQKYDFQVGETVMISGRVLALENGFPLLLRLINPHGAACSFQQLTLDKDMKFEAEPIKLDGKLCSVEGEYKITAFYGKGRSLTKFSVAASNGELTGGEAEVLNARMIPSFIRYDNKYTVDLDWASNTVRLRNNMNQTITFYLIFAEYDADEITKRLSYSEVTLEPFGKDYVVAPFVPQIIDDKPNGYLHVFAWTSLNEPVPLHPGLYVPY